MLYLDNAATTWPKPETVYLVHDAALRRGGNAGRGVNQASLAASRELMMTRETLACFFNIPAAEQVIFTQNVTESLNVGLQGLLQPGDHVLVSSLEHNAVIRPLEHLKAGGISYTVIPCAPEGILNVSSLEEYRTQKTRMLCFTHASNVLGTIMPIRELGRYAREHELLFMVDAAQSAGVLPIDVQDMNIDFLAFTGHKGLLGPAGTGGFYVRKGLSLRPLLYGGTGIHSARLAQPEVWPEGLESGTRNVAGLAALRAGVEFILEQGLEQIRRHELDLIKNLLKGLETLPGAEILGPRTAERRVGLVACNFAGFSADGLAHILDRDYGIITRSGLHCAPLAHQTAGTLKKGALRISPGFFNTGEDIEKLISALLKILKGATSHG